MTTNCPHCATELDAGAIEAAENGNSCPTCGGDVSAVVPWETEDESRKAGSKAAAAAVWHGVNRNIRILGSAALLVLGGLAVFLATRDDGETVESRTTMKNREVTNEYVKRLVSSGVAPEKDLAWISEARPWGTSLVGISRDPLDWKSAQDLAKRTASEILEIPADRAGGRLPDWLAEVWRDEVGRTAWIRQGGEMKVIDSPDIGTVTTPERPRRVFLLWKNAMPGGWSWTIEPRFDEALPFAPCGLARVRVGKSWGLVDHGGNVVLKPAFDSIGEFSEHGSAILISNGKSGLVDDKGKVLAQPEWEAVQPHIHGFTPVERNGKWGYLDAAGKPAISCEWDEAWRFSAEGFAVVTRNGKRGFIDKTGKVIVEPEWDGAVNFAREGIGLVRRGDGWGMIDTSGKLLCEPVWQTRWADRRLDLGYLPVWQTTAEGVRYGLLGLDGRLKEGLSPQSHSAVPKIGFSKTPRPSAGGPPAGWEFSETSRPGHYHDRHGEAQVSTNITYPNGEIMMREVSAGTDFSSDHIPYALPPKYGFMDTRGKVIAAPKWDEVRVISPDWVVVRSGDRCGLADKTGKVVIETDWESLEVLEVDSSSLGNDGTRLLLGRDGNRILSPWVRVARGNDIRLFHTDGREAMRLEKGNDEITLRVNPGSDGSLPAELAGAEYVDFYGPDLLMFRKPDTGGRWKWFSYDPTKRDLVAFPGAETFRWNWNSAAQGVIWMKESASGDWRLLDQRGHYLGHTQTPQPDGWCYFDGRALLETPDGWKFIDKQGKVIGGTWPMARDFCGGRAAVMRDGKWGFIDTEGRLVAEPTWTEVRDFELGLAAVKAENGWWGFLGTDGKVAIQPVWNEVGEFARVGTDPTGTLRGQERDVAPVCYNGVWGCMDRTGRLVVDPKHFGQTTEFTLLFSDGGLAASAFPKRVTSWKMEENGAPVIWGTRRFSAIKWRLADDNGNPVSYHDPNQRWQYDDGRPVLVNGSPLTTWREREKLLTNHFPFVNGLPVSKTGRWIEPFYDNGWPDEFSGGLIPARTAGQKYALLRLDGVQITPPLHDRIAWVAPGVAAAWSGDDGGLMDRSGKWLFRDNGKIRVARFGLKNARSTEHQHRRGLVIIEDPPKWGYAKLNR